MLPLSVMANFNIEPNGKGSKWHASQWLARKWHAMSSNLKMAGRGIKQPKKSDSGGVVWGIWVGVLVPHVCSTFIL